MSPPRARRYGGPGGFTVIELLIAMAITLLIAGAVANVAPQARVAFERVPAELDLQQRGRSALDAFSRMLPSALSVSDGGDASTLTVTAPVPNGGRGALSVAAAGTTLLLAASPCPAATDVCGFVTGATAMISDGLGHTDVFIVAATNAGARRLTADRVWPQPYPAGAAILEIDRYTYRLASQTDGSFSLIRETTAGAIQPMVDFVSDLSFAISVDRVDVSLRVGAATESLRRLLPDRIFRTSITLRNVS